MTRRDMEAAALRAAPDPEAYLREHSRQADGPGL